MSEQKLAVEILSAEPCTPGEYVRLLSRLREMAEGFIGDEGFNERARHGLLGRATYDGTHRVRFYEGRIAVSRVDGERLTWDELQAVKRQTIGDVTAIEVYPPKRMEVNLRHTRHLWYGPEVTRFVDKNCRHPEFGS